MTVELPIAWTLIGPVNAALTTWAPQVPPSDIVACVEESVFILLYDTLRLGNQLESYQVSLCNIRRIGGIYHRIYGVEIS